MGEPKKVRVLIAEDDFLVSEMVSGFVDEIGFEIIGKAANGRETVEMTVSLQPDIVLMDIKMPDMDGIEATRRIFEIRPTPVVALTAFDNPSLVEQASAAGIGAYLLKPSQPRELERAIAIAIARFDDFMKLRRLNERLNEAISKVRQLKGLLPICASCKMIRDDKGYWHQVEAYVKEHSEAEFSPGLCPDCVSRIFGKKPKEPV